MTTNKLRKHSGPPTDSEGRRIIEREVTINASSYHTNNSAHTLPGDDVPTRNGISLRIEEAESHRIVFQMDMSVVQWIKLQQSVIVSTSYDDRPQALLDHMPSSLVHPPEPDTPAEPEYHRLADKARNALNTALSEYEEAVDDLEALHSEKAGRAAMQNGIRNARTAISRAASNVQYANRILHEHVQDCLRTMLIDERFSAQQRAAGAGEAAGETAAAAQAAGTAEAAAAQASTAEAGSEASA